MEFINSSAAAVLKLPFSEAVRVGNVLYLSGQIGNLPGKMQLAPGGFAAEVRQMMANIGRVLAQSGLTFDDVFKCTAMLADIAVNGRPSTKSISAISSRTGCRRARPSAPAGLRWAPPSRWSAGPVFPRPLDGGGWGGGGATNLNIGAKTLTSLSIPRKGRGFLCREGLRLSP
jgi:enamine deaminase RidA (YjgF/YER057c/UK114 family)